MNFKLLAIVLGAVVLLSTTAFLAFHKRTQTSTMFDASGVPHAVVAAFTKFTKEFKKVYPTKEVASYRLRVFFDNYDNIERANADRKNTFKSGINQFTDMTLEEFKNVILMRDLPKVHFAATYEIPEGQNISNDIDWRDKGAVTPIKNQGSCGSCWSFSTTGALEGSSFLQGGKLQSLSEQQLVDCCGKDGFQCQGCSGAWPEWALNWVKAKGIATEAKYPYTGYEGACTQDSGDFHISSYNMIAAGNEDAVVSAANVQPVSICVDASTWFSYSSGIFNGCTASPQLDHAVLIVGYTADHYIVKNSWDTTWGEQGYIRLPKGANACGLANHAITTKI